MVYRSGAGRRQPEKSLSLASLPPATSNGIWLAEGFFWDGTYCLGIRLRHTLEDIGYDYRPLALRCHKTGNDFWESIARVLIKRGITDLLYASGVQMRGRCQCRHCDRQAA